MGNFIEGFRYHTDGFLLLFLQSRVKAMGRALIQHLQQGRKDTGSLPHEPCELACLPSRAEKRGVLIYPLTRWLIRSMQSKVRRGYEARCLKSPGWPASSCSEACGETSACTCATSGSMLLASIYIVHYSYTKHACFSVPVMFFEHCRKTSLINHAADLH